MDAEVEAREGVVVDFHAIKADALIDPRQMGRGVKTGAQAGGGEDRGQRGGSGAFAVGSGNQHGGKAALRIAQRCQQDANLVEREFAPRLAGALDRAPEPWR